MFRSMWYVLVNVTIMLGSMYRNAHTFHMTTILHWQSRSEMFGTRKHRPPYQVLPVALPH